MEINPQIGTPSTEEVKVQNENPVQEISQVSVKQEESDAHGLAQEEINDPNQIQITIADKQNPIVVLFGPPACGKTMTLVRLTRYLKTKGYRVEPIGTFRPSTDTHYADICKGYNEMINNSNAAESTSMISFMLVRIIDKNGKTLCQILEAPGEYYYNPKKPSAGFPRYVNAIKNGPNRKIWCYMVEPNWKDEADRVGYVDKIKSLKSGMRPSDKAVFIFNKIDLTPFVITPGKINIKQARREVENLYPGIFEAFKVKGILTTSDDFEFVPFHTGDYSETFNGGFSFEAGPDEYPKTLWNTILDLVRG